MAKRVCGILLAVALILPAAPAHAFALHYPASYYDRIAWTWQYYAPYSRTYNCLAYSLGITDRWVWPWGSGYPSALQVTEYMRGRGHPPCPRTGSPRIIAYGVPPSRYDPVRWGAVDHFSKVIGPGATRAKWGSLEVMTSQSWSPYYRFSYGIPVAYYR
jgi:hypothetical protein